MSDRALKIWGTVAVIAAIVLWVYASGCDLPGTCQ